MIILIKCTISDQVPKKHVKSFVLDEQHLNFIIGIQKNLTNLLKELKESEIISEIDYTRLKRRG